MSSHKKLSAGLLAVFLSAVAVPGALADASKYIVTDLGTNPGTSSTSPAIQLTCLNNYGQIAGTETTSPYISQGLLWTPYIANSTRGTFTGLGTFGGAATGATGINDAGKVTGWCQVQDPNYTGSSYVYWAFIWSPFQANGTSGQGSPILPPPFLIAPNPAEGETWGGIYAVGASPAINNADQIADQAWFHYLVTDPNDPPYDDAIYEPGIWNGNWSDLNGTPYWSYNNGSPIYPRAYDSVISANSKSINNNGDVVGVWDGSPADFGVAHICVWKSDGSFIDIHRGGTFNNNYGEGVINDEGLVTGVASAAYPGDHNGGIVWDSLHGIQDLGGLPPLPGSVGPYAFPGGTVPLSINNNGQVVGFGDRAASATPAGGTPEDAFIWDSANGAQDLNDLIGCKGADVLLESAESINDSGQILCWGATNNKVHYYLLNPVDPATIQFSVTDLGTLGGPSSAAYGINDAGSVVGQSDTADGDSHAFLWTPSDITFASGQMSDLGVAYGGTDSIARSISDAGLIAGSAGLDSLSLPVLWLYDSSMLFLDSGGGSGDAFQVSDGGGIAGQAQGADGDYYAFDADPVYYTQSNLGNFAGQSIQSPYASARAVNNSGSEAGEALTAGGAIHAFVHTGTQMTDLGTLPGGSYSSASGICDDGDVAGEADTAAGETHAFVCDGGQMTDLGALPNSSFGYSTALGINNICAIVGTSNTDDGLHAFLDMGTTMVDLNDRVPQDSGWTLQVALGVNDQMQIVGYGLVGGQQHAFLLTPVFGTQSGSNGVKGVPTRKPVSPVPPASAGTPLVYASGMTGK